MRHETMCKNMASTSSTAQARTQYSPASAPHLGKARRMQQSWRIAVPLPRHATPLADVALGGSASLATLPRVPRDNAATVVGLSAAERAGVQVHCTPMTPAVRAACACAVPFLSSTSGLGAPIFFLNSHHIQQSPSTPSSP